MARRRYRRSHRYIIGLPFDTKAQVSQDIRFLMDEIQPDQSSFFMLTPLPGSHALSNRALYSREPLQQFWNNTMEHLRGIRIWNIDPGKLATSLIKDFILTMSFAFTYRAGIRME